MRRPKKIHLSLVSAFLSVQVGLDVIRKEACSFYRTISGVRLCWDLEEPKGPKGPKRARLSVCDCRQHVRVPSKKTKVLKGPPEIERTPDDALS